MELNKRGLCIGSFFKLYCYVFLYHVNFLNSIEHTFPYSQGAGYGSTAYQLCTFIPSVSPHFCKTLWIRTSVRSLSVDTNAKTPRSVASVFSWERSRPILPQPGHGGGIPLFLFLFSPCAPSSDRNVSGLACGKARTRTGA